MFNLDQAIAEWRRQMGASGVKTPEVLNELESHLRDDVDQQVRSGLGAQQAFESTVGRIGEASLLKAEFEKAGGTKEVRLRKDLLRAIAIGVGLFAAGGGFCYFVILPLVMQANERYALWLGVKASDWGMGVSFSFMCRFMLGMGLALAMPVGLLALVKIGILDYRNLARFRRYMIVANLILGALLTTPDVVTQIIMFVPLQLVYEATILIAWNWERKTKQRA